MARNDYSKCLTNLMNELEQIETAIRDIQNEHDVFNLQGSLKSDYVTLLSRSLKINSERCQLSIDAVNYDIAS